MAWGYAKGCMYFLLYPSAFLRKQAIAMSLAFYFLRFGAGLVGGLAYAGNSLVHLLARPTGRAILKSARIGTIMETSSTITRRVAVFGLDGVTFDLLQPWLDEGRLPNLAALLAGGAHGRLRSTIPPVSASAWASFSTGTNPGQHGLVDFTYPGEDGYEIQITNGRTRAVPALWEIVSAAGGPGRRRQYAHDLPAAAAQRLHALLLPDPQPGKPIHLPARTAG